MTILPEHNPGPPQTIPDGVCKRCKGMRIIGGWIDNGTGDPIPCPLCRRNPKAQTEDRIAELEAKIADYQAAWQTAMDEQCDPIEEHCPCVPALRSRVKEIEAENARLKGLIARAVKTSARMTRSRHKRPPYNKPVWGQVAEMFCVGSTSASQLCRDAGIDHNTGDDIQPALAAKEGT